MGTKFNKDTKVPYVLTLTILDSNSLAGRKITKDSLVRCCVRNNLVNLTHPDVVSVPTQRIPKSLAKDILSSSVEVGIQDNTVLRKQAFVSNKDTKGHHPVIYAVECLLSRKLGISSKLEKNEIEFYAALAGTHVGVAKYKNLDDEEQLQMINVQVVITKGADLLPASTASYDISNWISVESFLRMWDSGKDVTLAGVDFNKAMGICVDGLCILSTYDILKASIS